jgi:methanethiol S-methyltransferase
MIVLDFFITLFLFFLFAASHTFLASERIKIRLAERLGPRIAFYRLFYTLSSCLILGTVLIIAPKPDIILYDLQYPFDIITFVLQIFSLFGLIWTVRYIDVKEFLGISQILRYLSETYVAGDLDERRILTTTGPFRLCRHPVYFFSLLFLVLRPTMSLFYAEFVLFTALYFYIGSIYEEKKLVQFFGDEYIRYREEVPRIIPVSFRKKR